ncbi:hypothetical protein [Salidesulfovibrio onnuriiensis]|uniref:hypothetical protein n=1 Tax=Salidesulfovibrio onnuriiensis TaxID=2583823 RepID=UPI0011CB5FD9|nr:hypothetical protein [Salidesulfovibrio onnuriiensis]
MKIGQGKSSFGGWGASTQERAEIFRRSHRVGQKVHGRLIRWQGAGLAWVNIGNQPLLAQIKSRPIPGARLTFIIQKLTPEIILKEVFEGSQAGLPIYDLIKEFNALRNTFESVSNALWRDFPTTQSSANKRTHFLNRLEQDDTATQAFHEVTACAARINSFLAQNDLFFYWPWMQPGGRHQAGYARRNCDKKNAEPFYELTYEFESPAFGLTQIRTLYRHPKAGFRIQAQHLPRKISLQQHLDRLAIPQGMDANCIGVERLPADRHGGILSSLLHPTG